MSVHALARARARLPVRVHVHACVCACVCTCACARSRLSLGAFDDVTAATTNASFAPFPVDRLPKPESVTVVAAPSLTRVLLGPTDSPPPLPPLPSGLAEPPPLQ